MSRRLDTRSQLIGHARLIFFLGAAAGAGAKTYHYLESWWLPAASMVIFVGFVFWHAAVAREEARTQALVDLQKRGLMRLDGQWRNFASKGERFAVEGHLYGADLDVFGQGSLFQLLDETATRQGEEVLARWLFKPPEALAEVRERQGAVEELSKKLEFRQALVTEAKLAGPTKADLAKFLAWAEGPGLGGLFTVAFALAHVLPLVTIVLEVLAQQEILLPWVPFLGLLAQLVLMMATFKPLGGLFEALLHSEQGAVRFERAFAAVAAEKFEHPLLSRLRTGAEQDGQPVAAKLSRFERLFGFASLKAAKEVHWIFNWLLLWDLHFLVRLDQWRAKHGKQVRRWFDSLSELEALASLSTFRFERPETVFPTLLDGPARFKAVGLGHPLLEKPVVNDVELSQPGAALVITGSNMSGKTTFLRTIGITEVAALAGLPVVAKQCEVSLMQAMTSMRLKDSLERGVSYFYAEVQRVKLLLDTARARPQGCLFLLDELFLGTNARERAIASKALVKQLLELGGIGAITTHDLALTELAGGKVVNVHFTDSVDGVQMTFDYRLREGIAQTTNALELLRRAGVPVS
ncbi:MAG: DNA mismatch repair protein MutS [Myxococcaceae bacterium]